MSAQMTFSLPQEILDYIVDYLHNDKATLLSCSTASKSLSDCGSHHLFHNIAIQLNMQTWQTQLHEFFTFVSNAPRARYIRRLSILGNVPNHRYHDYVYESFLSPSFRDIERLLGRIPSLQHLEFKSLRIIHNGVDYVQPSDDEVIEFAHRLQSLSLWQCIFGDISTTLPELLRLTKPYSLRLRNPACATLLGLIPPEQSHVRDTSIPMPVESLLILPTWSPMGSWNEDVADLLEHLFPRISHNLIHSLGEFTLLLGTWPSLRYAG